MGSWASTTRPQDPGGRGRVSKPGANTLVRGPNKGYIDRFGNEWTKGPTRTTGEAFEWDVIPGRNARTWFKDLAKDGTHVNVSLGGVVTH